MTFTVVLKSGKRANIDADNAAEACKRAERVARSRAVCAYEASTEPRLWEAQVRRDARRRAFSGR